jgi:rhodanese-related sulfurtransferase
MYFVHLNTPIILSIFISSLLLAKEETSIGCSSSVSVDQVGCEAVNLLEKEKKDIFRIEEKSFFKDKIQTNISKELSSVMVSHKGKELTIIRSIENGEKSCPPYCITPMNIEGVKTVGELETLEFLKSLQEQGNILVLDTRESRYYNKGTIPGALNLPAHMLSKESKYFDDVIAVLGIKRSKNNWSSKDIHQLLIFDDGITDNKALKAIKSLRKLSYPADKIFYYRGGFESWKKLGLTTYVK